jgi:hypothetical protein
LNIPLPRIKFIEETIPLFRIAVIPSKMVKSIWAILIFIPNSFILLMGIPFIKGTQPVILMLYLPFREELFIWAVHPIITIS